MSARLYRRIAALLALAIAVLGFGLLVSTAVHGGGTSGYLIGALFVALGSGRLYLLKKRS
ncbi:MAG: hypothetical protein JWM06_203 [Actinomycetia bacterium]|nr:hypothetical protein [Actinomycetes bacterium]